ncbi:MAG: hypothetical protein IJV15_11245 [Lachnospiraceae bacterium]|nr:hypothetical protein [Lachnospiraceae bacterium]
MKNATEENVNINDVTNEKADNNGKKKIRLSSIIIFFAILAAGVYFIYTNFFGAKPELTVNGKKVTMRSTIQELYDNGFVLCSDSGSVLNPSGSVGGKQIYNISYHLGVPRGDGGYADLTGIIITPANFDSGSKDIKECSIYEIVYYPAYDSAAADVLINGEKLDTDDLSTWADFFAEKKYPFEESEINGFRNSNNTILLGKTGRYKFEARAVGYGEEAFSYIRFTRNIEVKYETR